MEEGVALMRHRNNILTYKNRRTAEGHGREKATDALLKLV